MNMTNPKDCPAYDKGRWYTAFIETVGDTHKITTIDKDLEDSTISGGHLKFPDSFHAIDCLVDVDCYGASAAGAIKAELYKYSAGNHAITLASTTQCTDQYVYVFGYFE